MVDYQKIEKIGEGTYGVVYKAKDKNTGEIVALKKIRFENENDGVPSTTIREISILKTLKHSTIITLLDVIYTNNRLYLVFEYLDLDLRKYLDMVGSQNKTLSDVQLKKNVQQLITSVHFCHSRGVLHRDLKPQNILVDKNGNLKLADFGLGRIAGIPLRTYTHDIVTLWYRSPELLLGCKHYSFTVDVWSMGCIIAEMFLLKPLFPGDCEIDQLYKIFRVFGTPNDSVWPNVTRFKNFQAEFPKWEGVPFEELVPATNDFTELLLKMLVYYPIKRITAKEALKCKFLEGLPPIYE